MIMSTTTPEATLSYLNKVSLHGNGINKVTLEVGEVK
jgi:hypothetical protein